MKKNKTSFTLWYDPDGNPTTYIEAEKYLSNRKTKIVKQQTTRSGRLVSTVYLGLNYSFIQEKILIYETMVFQSGQNLSELDVQRYETRKEAKAGHKAMFKKWNEIRFATLNSIEQAIDKII